MNNECSLYVGAHKYSLTGIKPSSFVHLLFRAAFALPWQTRIL